ncbi:DAHL domain-containing protein [Thalassococcus sp. S3]|uniref:DAHL domain-containing protein n=1 Tax=Thalassococcus sp. S3 TaxID=2017482 RepID=UPI0013EEC964|nr:DAHL domain-containing protein [Thalassococcus sp. S3]
MAISIAVLSALTLGFAAALTLLQSSNRDFEQFRTGLAELQALESSWSSDILALQLGLMPNFDPVSYPIRQLRSMMNDLEEATENSRELTGFQSDLQDYAAAFDQKVALAESVKASYAILINSASTLPIAVSEFFEHSGEKELSADVQFRLADLLSRISTGIASYMITPSEALRERLETELQLLDTVIQETYPELSDSTRRLMAHADVVLRERQLGSELMLAVPRVATGDILDRLQNKIAALQVSSEAVRTRTRDAAILFGLLVLTGLSLLIWRARQRFRKMDQDKLSLQKANKDAQDQLIQSAKLSAMGQMVAGITHEVNTPLAYVKTVFELIKEKLLERSELMVDPDVEDGAEDGVAELEMLINDGLHGIEEISTLVTTMKNFSRLDRGRIEKLSVEEALDSALLIARSKLKYVAEVVKDYDNVPDIVGAPTQLKQVFLNLINNAVHALSEQNKQGRIVLRTQMTSSDFVKIEIRDNGPGIPEEIMAQIFDPFFTTKAVGEGTGMGLSICYRIIENHGGTISVNSVVGKGTVFTITLPRRGTLEEGKEMIGDHESIQAA